jgi:hypothetical protein
MLLLTAASFGQVAISVKFAPPALPVYEQPPCPDDGYLWTPGYWAYDDSFDDYYWVPGTWVMAPEPGFLWTPPYWGWGGEAFIFHEGYWGPQVGFYGGIAYGFGYFGVGFEGGHWDSGHFFYNRSVTNVNVTNIHNVYNTTVVNSVTVNRVSYNGGEGGITARPTAQEEAAAQERHVPPVEAQTQQVQAARGNQQLRASVNQGKPPVAATPKPGAFSGGGVVQAKEAGAPYHPPANRAAAEPKGNQPGAEQPRADQPRPDAANGRAENNNADHPNPAVHPNDLPPAERAAAPNTGDAKQDKKIQQQQQKLAAQQDKERQKLQKQQDQEHKRLAQQKADPAKTQQLEQKHQQQTQQLQQRQAEQQQKMQMATHPSEARPPKGK